MSYLDKYHLRDSMYGDGIRDIRVNNTKRKVSSSFKDSPSYYSVTLNGSPIDSQIVDDSQTRDEKLLTTYYETPISYGSVIEWKSTDDKWIVIHYDEMSEIYKRCRIRKCLGSLKWLNEDGFEREVDFTISSPTSNIFAVEDGQVISIGKERRQLLIPNTVDSKKIKKGKRFIIDENAWKIIAIDRKSSKGLIYLTVQEDEIKDAADSLELEIADYYGNAANYSISITNGNSFSIRANQTLQLYAEVKNNGSIVSKPVTWSISDSSIASIDANGLITAHANGTAVVSIQLIADGSVTDTATLNVEFATVNNYSIELDSSLDLLVGTSKTFTAIVKNNNVIDSSRTVQIYCFADDGTSNPTSATMTMNSSTQFTLKGNKVGYVRMLIYLVGSSPVFSQDFRIKVESLI